MDIPKYKIIEEIGQGAFGVVYLVEHKDLGSLHALKLLKEWDEGAADRLLIEGRLQAKLVHPNIVRVTDTVRTGAHLGIVMEYVRGPSLAQVLAFGRRLTIEEIDILARGIIEGSAAAHAQGLVHRDLKPANILLDLSHKRPIPKITDFGLARLLGESVARKASGTPGFLPLEQLMGDPASPSMDVFAIGAILYELIEGTPAFESPSRWRDSVMEHRYPRPTRADLPDGMRAALLASLCERSQRCDNAGALLAIWMRDRRESTAASLPPPHQPLPLERGPFVGRLRELEALERMMASGTRLVTIHGPRGVGKTRLAVRCAAKSEHLAFFCDLSEASTSESIVSAVARSIAVSLGPDPIRQIGSVLARRGACIFVLDSADALSEHPHLLDQWIDAAPEVTFLVTSCALLKVSGERVLDLMPLPLGEAVELFHLCAEAASSTYRREEEPARAVVQSLDGLPLAIELHAPLVRLYSVSEMLALPRESTRDSRSALDAALDRSYSRLSPRERLALAQCSVFRGGFTVEAAAAVLSLGHSEGPQGQEDDILDILMMLADKSLIFRNTQRRLDLLKPILRYAEAKFAEDDSLQREVWLRHAKWLAERRRLPEHLKSREELDNLLIATERMLSIGAEEIALRTASEALSVYRFQGPAESGERFASEVEARCSTRSGAGWVWLQWAHASLLIEAGRFKEGAALAKRALTDAKACRAQRAEVMLYAALGTALGPTKGYEAARSAWKQGLVVARACKYPEGEGLLLSNLAESERPPNLRLYESALALQEQSGDLISASVTRANIAVLEAQRGHYASAMQMLEECLDHYRAIGRSFYEIHVLANIADISMRTLEFDKALEHINEAIALARRTGLQRGLSVLLGIRGQILFSWGKPSRDSLEEALSVARTAQDLPCEAFVQRFLGLLTLVEDPSALAAASGLLARSADAHHEVGEYLHEAETRAYLAEISAMGGDRSSFNRQKILVEALAAPYDAVVEAVRIGCALARGAAWLGDLQRSAELIAAARSLMPALEELPDLKREVEQSEQQIASLKGRWAGDLAGRPPR